MNEPSAPSAVVDTNLFVSGIILETGLPRRLLRAWHERRFVLLLSDAQHGELVDVLARPKIVQRYRVPPEDLTALFAALARITRVQLARSLPVPVRDAKDEMILAAAFGGDADFLVTGDDDLLVLRDDPRLGKLRILTVGEFLAILEEQERPRNSRPPDDPTS